MTRHELLAHLRQLYFDLASIIARDPEQEILGIALPVVDRVISAAREQLAASGLESGLASGLCDLISPSSIHTGTPVRAVDTWVVVGQVLAAFGHDPAGASAAAVSLHHAIASSWGFVPVSNPSSPNERRL